jgi:hypothetical protein
MFTPEPAGVPSIGNPTIPAATTAIPTTPAAQNQRRYEGREIFGCSILDGL